MSSGTLHSRSSPRRMKPTAPMQRQKPSKRCQDTCDPNMTARLHSPQKENSATANW
nr:MAG TPA: hypothetical protein [Caudoviricetes sp.]